MAKSITEKILGNNKFYTDKYLKDSINLVKSIILTSSKEAVSYNDYIAIAYPQFNLDLNDKTTWRYYKHITSEQHPLDQPITLTSIDNGETITLSPTTIHLHRITRNELLKFDLFYKELVDRFPEQELYIKSVINTSSKLNLQQVINAEDYTIVSYDDNLVEDNEDDIIETLQQRIYNYKNISLITYYSLSDNLFMASQYHILYSFILTTIISLRLKNAKTLRAHSYHILNYLSSHHYLDAQFNYLTKKQALFLYRNLLYLNNHAGREDTFRLLIERLFTERNISVVSYIYEQTNQVDDKHYTDYRFKQKLLNNSDLVYSYTDFSLDDIHRKEFPLAPSNPKELTYNKSNSDQLFKNSLFNTLLTKDLETVIVDNTDTVRYKLIPTIIDYWAYLLQSNRMRYLVTILDPITNKELRLSTKDLFKLFVIILYKGQGQTLTAFPDYTIKRVYRSEIPTVKQLLSFFYKKKYYYKDIAEEITTAIPRYTNTITSFQFEQFVSSIYKFNIGLWLMQSNMTDKNQEGQFDYLIDNLHQTLTYTYADETPDTFLKRIGLNSIELYDQTTTEAFQYSILNNLFDNRLSFINKYQYIQKALIEVFKNFNSYTIQIIDNYTTNSPLLVGPKDPRVAIAQEVNIKSYYYDAYNLNVDMYYHIRTQESLDIPLQVQSGSRYYSHLDIPATPEINITCSYHSQVAVYFNNNLVNGLESENWIVTPSSDADLEFLALHF